MGNSLDESIEELREAAAARDNAVDTARLEWESAAKRAAESYTAATDSIRTKIISAFAKLTGVPEAGAKYLLAEWQPGTIFSPHISGASNIDFDYPTKRAERYMQVKNRVEENQGKLAGVNASTGSVITSSYQLGINRGVISFRDNGRLFIELERCIIAQESHISASGRSSNKKGFVQLGPNSIAGYMEKGTVGMYLMNKMAFGEDAVREDMRKAVTFERGVKTRLKNRNLVPLFTENDIDQLFSIVKPETQASQYMQGK